MKTKTKKYPLSLKNNEYFLKNKDKRKLALQTFKTALAFGFFHLSSVLLDVLLDVVGRCRTLGPSPNLPISRRLVPASNRATKLSVMSSAKISAPPFARHDLAETNQEKSRELLFFSKGNDFECHLQSIAISFSPHS